MQTIIQKRKQQKINISSHKNPLETELIHANHQIQLLRAENQELKTEIKQLEAKISSLSMACEQTSYRKQEGDFKTSLIQNYSDINKRLYEKIKELEQSLSSINSTKHLAATIQSSSNRLQSLDISMATIPTFRQSHLRQDLKGQLDLHKQNHAITPKSRVRIDVGLFDDKIGIKRKVFI